MTRRLVLAVSMLLLVVPAARAQDGGGGHVIGLLEVPDVIDLVRCQPTLEGPVDLFASPSTRVKVGELRAAPAQPTLAGHDFECEGGHEVRIFLGSSPSGELETLEHGYEEESLVVTATVPGWYRIRTGGEPALAWLRATPRSVYRPLSVLYEDGLTYLSEDWDGRVHVRPNGTFRVVPRPWRDGDREISVRVDEVAAIAGVYWARITFVPEPCRSDESEMRAVGRGWVRVHQPLPSARPMLWFHSRGC